MSWKILVLGSLITALKTGFFAMATPPPPFFPSLGVSSKPLSFNSHVQTEWYAYCLQNLS